MTFHTLHSGLSREELKTLVFLTHFVKCLAKKDIHSLRSLCQPSSLAFCLCQPPVSSSLKAGLFPPSSALQSADVRPGSVFHPPTSGIWTEQERIGKGGAFVKEMIQSARVTWTSSIAHCMNCKLL